MNSNDFILQRYEENVKSRANWISEFNKEKCHCVLFSLWLVIVCRGNTLHEPKPFWNQFHQWCRIFSTRSSTDLNATHKGNAKSLIIPCLWSTLCTFYFIKGKHEGNKVVDLETKIYKHWEKEITQAGTFRIILWICDGYVVSWLS